MVVPDRFTIEFGGGVILKIETSSGCTVKDSTVVSVTVSKVSVALNLN